MPTEPVMSLEAFMDDKDIPYRSAMSELISTFLREHQSIGQNAIENKAQYSNLSDNFSDAVYIDHLAERVDMYADDVFDNGLRKRTIGDLDESASYHVMTTYLFGIEMFRYACAKASSVVDPTVYAESMVQQVEHDLNPRYTDQREQERLQNRDYN